jgi:hypothetical protein
MSDDDKLFSSATVASTTTLQQYNSDVPKDQIASLNHKRLISIKSSSTQRKKVKPTYHRQYESSQFEVVE